MKLMRGKAAVAALVLTLLAVLSACGSTIRIRQSDRRQLAEVQALRELAYGRAVYLRSVRMPDDAGLRRDLIRPYEQGVNRTEVLVRVLLSEIDVNAPYGTINGMLFDGVLREAVEQFSKFLRWTESLTTYAWDGRLEERGYESAPAQRILESAKEAADRAQAWWMEEEDRPAEEWRAQVRKLPLPQWIDLPRE